MLRSLILVSCLLISPISTGTSLAKDLLWQTNAEGDDIHIFDIETGDLVERLVVGPNPHGIGTAGDTVFVSLENNGGANGELLWIDSQSREIQYRLDVGPEPHALAVTPDGKWVYVPCRDGHYWVIDADQRAVTARIETGGRPHNTTAHPNGSRVYLSPMGAPKQVTVVDPGARHSIVGFIPFSASVRPPALAPSLNLFFQHVDGLNGFEVANLENNALIFRAEHSAGLGMPVWPSSLGFAGFGGLSRCHGLAVRPGDKEIWSICGANATIHDITNPDFPEIDHIALPSKGYWLTHSPDGRYVFIALADAGQVAMVEAETREIIRLLNAGDYPKRNLVLPTQ